MSTRAAPITLILCENDGFVANRPTGFQRSEGTDTQTATGDYAARATASTGQLDFTLARRSKLTATIPELGTTATCPAARSRGLRAQLQLNATELDHANDYMTGSHQPLLVDRAVM